MKKNFASNLENYFGFSWRGWIRSSIWIVTFAVLAGLMIQELISNLTEYKGNNIIPQISVVEPAESKPPNLTICVPYYSNILNYVANCATKNVSVDNDDVGECNTTCHECEGMRNNSWDVWSNINTSLFETDLYGEFPDARNAEHYVALALVSKLVNDSEGAAAALNKSNEANLYWNQAIVDALWLYFSCVVSLDRSALTGNPGECLVFDFQSLENVSDTTLDRLYDLLLDALEVYVSLTPESLKTTESLIPLGDKMCFRMPWNSNWLRVSYIDRQIIQKDGTVYNPWTHPKTGPKYGWMEIFEDVMFYDIENSYQTLFQTQRNLLPKLGISEVKLTYNVRTRVDVREKDSACSEDTVPLACLAKRHYITAVERCGCVPFSLRYLRERGNNLTYCNYGLYEQCVQTQSMTQTHEADVSYCNNRCEYTDYKYCLVSNVSEGNTFVSGQFGLTIDLFSANGSFIKIDFTSKTTFNQFMSQLGGTLNLYLGLSGFTICAFVFFLIDATKRWRRLRNISTQPSDQPGPSLGLHQSWFISALQRAAKQEDQGAKNESEDATKQQLTAMADKIEKMDGKIDQLAGIIDKIVDRMDKIEVLADRISVSKPSTNN